ncbi:hypothetical protein B484DRAFT_405301, partial [Ochromonadaceae sp. CCMP2298]
GTGVSLEKECVRIILARIIAGSVNTQRQPTLVRARLRALCLQGSPQTVAELITKMISASKKINDSYQEAVECGLASNRIPKKDLERNLQCSLTAHPDYNKSEAPWASSRSGIKYAAAGKNRLTFGKDVTGAANGMVNALLDTGAVIGNYCSRAVASTPLRVDEIIGAMQIAGPDSLQCAIRALVTEFTDVFSNDVGETPAIVEPMTLEKRKSAVR